MVPVPLAKKKKKKAHSFPGSPWKHSQELPRLEPSPRSSASEPQCPESVALPCPHWADSTWHPPLASCYPVAHPLQLPHHLAANRDRSHKTFGRDPHHSPVTPPVFQSLKCAILFPSLKPASQSARLILFYRLLFFSFIALSPIYLYVICTLANMQIN